MKIKSYKKLKNSCYKITFKDSSKELLLYDEVILKYNLLLKKEITEKELQEIIKENHHYSCYYHALKYITNKNRSKKEIREFLKRRNFEVRNIENVIKILEEKKYIDEENYLKMYIHDQIELTYNGPKKISEKLKDLGFQEEIISKELSIIPKEVWLSKLEHIIQKKVNANKKDGQNKIKEKILYNGLNEGFLKEDILCILENIDIPKNNSALEKETQKLYNKLSQKYEGSTLIYQIKGRLLNKGFSYEEIDKALESIKKTSY